MATQTTRSPNRWPRLTARNIYLDFDVAFLGRRQAPVRLGRAGALPGAAADLDKFIARVKPRRHARAPDRALRARSQAVPAARRERAARTRAHRAPAIPAALSRRAGEDRASTGGCSPRSPTRNPNGIPARRAKPACAASCRSPRTRRGASASPTCSTLGRTCSPVRDTCATSRTRCRRASRSPTARGSRWPRTTSASAISRTRGCWRSGRASIRITGPTSSSALPLLALPEHYEKAKLGYARGGMPVAFVDRVRGYYDVLLAQQDAAPATVAPVRRRPGTRAAPIRRPLRRTDRGARCPKISR